MKKAAVIPLVLAAGILACNLSVVRPLDLPTALATGPVPTHIVQPASPTPIPQSRVNVTHAGYIAQDETWTGRHEVTGDIWVEPGVKLTIEPGATILVAANSDTQNLLEDEFDLRVGLNTGVNIDGVHRGEPFRDEANHISFWIDGMLWAVGTEQEPILITSASPNPAKYDWNRIQIGHGRIRYATIEYYRIIHTMTEDVEISNSVLRYVGECSICAYSDAKIIGNRIYDAGHELIDVRGNPTIRDNVIGPNPDHACIHIVGGNPVIENNQIHDSCP